MFKRVKSVLRYSLFTGLAALIASPVYSSSVQKLRFDLRKIRKACPPALTTGKNKCPDKTEFFAPADATFIIVAQENKKLYLQFRDVAQEGMAARQEQLKAVEARTTQYEVNAEDLPDHAYKFLHGLTHGPLAIPMKLQLSDGSISPGGNIGYFVGYRFLSHFTLIPMAVGFGAVNVATTNSTELKPQAAFTLATGFEYDLSQSGHNLGQGVQLGVFIGLDHSNGYAYSDRPWLAVGAGFNFNAGSN